jgi:hypothetical protein
VRPVPTVFLRLAFSDQLSVDAVSNAVQERRALDIGLSTPFVRSSRTLADLGSRVATRRTLMLLNVKRAATYFRSHQYFRPL